MEFHVIGVSELTNQIKQALEVPHLQNVAIRGEISNFKHHSSGHMYFTLKDEGSRIKAVMFRGRNQRLGFRPANGDVVVAVGSIGVYESNGDYQIYIELMLPEGVGGLHIAFEQLKERLDAEGLFSNARKKPLPYLPQKIGVITSPVGAALRDVLSVVLRRYPKLNVVVIPAIVQGHEGPKSIIRALNLAEDEGFDVLILARGGGSFEELSVFNDEQVVRAVSACSTPVITGIGHETDFTIADFVADQRAPTPSAAAELAVPSYSELIERIESLKSRMWQGITNDLKYKRQRYTQLVTSSVMSKPLDQIRQNRQIIDERLYQGALAINNRKQSAMHRLGNLVGKLDALSPLKTLQRGYSICQLEDGTIVKEYSQVDKGQDVKIDLFKGYLVCTVQKGEAKGEQG